ncbi:MAG TPA: ATP-binding cassette domain-containing protein [Chloroflexota bacterium]|nr:ATP-binding cassette domain-containing protein [Chloroflexota bacterium]
MVEVEDLTKTFLVTRKRGRLRRERVTLTAVSNICFAIEQGEMVGYIGPNGAGKSTTIKMLTGVLVPTSGQVRVANLNPVVQRIELARRIGVVFGQRRQLWWDLPLRDSFELLHHMYRVPEARFRKNLDRLVQLLDLAPCMDTPVRQLSLGQLMRGEVAGALLHDPQIVFLDEPTIGLDVVSKARLLEFLTEINREQGVTVLLTTHDIADVERLCERMLIIDRGKVIYDGGVTAIRERFGGERMLIVDLETPQPPLAVEGATVEQVDGARQWLRFRRSEISAARVIAGVVASAPVVDLALEEPAIEEIVRRIYLEGLPSIPAPSSQ